jgi:hypothetical protein
MLRFLRVLYQHSHKISSHKIFQGSCEKNDMPLSRAKRKIANTHELLYNSCRILLKFCDPERLRGTCRRARKIVAGFDLFKEF